MKSIVLAAALFITGMSFAQTPYKVGDEVKDFSLKNVDGKNVSLASMKDTKGVIVIFTCNHCPFSKAYEQRIMNLDKKYAPQGYPVVAINPNDPVTYPDDSYENMQKIAKEKGYSFPYLLDETQQVAKDFGASRTPHVFIVKNDKGKFYLEYIGAIDNNADEPEKADIKYVEQVVDALLSGNKTPYTETKAIGCTIKWKK